MGFSFPACCTPDEVWNVSVLGPLLNKYDFVNRYSSSNRWMHSEFRRLSLMDEKRKSLLMSQHSRYKIFYLSNMQSPAVVDICHHYTLYQNKNQTGLWGVDLHDVILLSFYERITGVVILEHKKETDLASKNINCSGLKHKFFILKTYVERNKVFYSASLYSKQFGF